MGSFDALLGTERRYTFTCAAVPPDTFALVDMEGEEGLSRLYRFTVTLMSENARINLDDLLYARATLTVYSKVEAAPPEPYHGMVVEFEQTHQTGPWTFYRAVLVPHAWRLTCFRLSEVYLNQTVPQVIEDVLKKAGLAGGDYQLELAGSYRTWPFICQYEETYLNFIGRLMERDGIYYFFDQGPEKEKLVITDQQTFQPNAHKAVWYRPAGGTGDPLREDAIQSFVGKRNPLAKKVVLQDYNYLKASLPLLAEAEVSPKGVGDLWIYGEHFETPDEGRRLAALRAEEILCRGKLYYGEGTVAGIRPGYTIDLKGHYRSDFDAAYEVTEIRHEGSQRGLLLGGQSPTSEPDSARVFYRNEFTAIPVEVQYRPPLTTPRPIIPGPVPAVVDAEGSGQYAELDEHGRYKVQVYFDQTEKAAGKGSHYIRAMTPSTGKDYGMHLLPHHKGAEVLVGFENGDPNRPVLLGAVPNSENLNTVTNANQTQSVLQTGGNNQITLEDQKGSERIRLSTPKVNTWLRMGAGNPPGSTVGAAAAGDGQAHEEGDGFAFATAGTYAGNVAGNYTLNVGGLLTEVIMGGEIHNVEGWSSDSCAGDRTDITLGAGYQDIFLGLHKLEIEVGLKTELTKTKMVLCEDEMEVLQNRVTTAENTITNHGTRIQNAETNITNHGTRLTNAETSITNHGTRIQNAETDITNHGTRLTNAETSITNHGTRIQNAETDIANHGTRLDTAETRIDTCETSINNVAMDLEDKETVVINAAIFMIS